MTNPRNISGISLSLIMTNGTTTDALFIQPRTLTPRERMINHPRCVTALPIKEDLNLALGTNDISLTLHKFSISDTMYPIFGLESRLFCTGAVDAHILLSTSRVRPSSVGVTRFVRKKREGGQGRGIIQVLSATPCHATRPISMPELRAQVGIQ